MKLLMQKHLGTLRPVDDAGAEALTKLKNGATLSVEVKQPRNGKHHRLYWALVGVVFQNQERYPDVETLHSALKIAAGIRTEIELPTGVKGYIPGSIAFHKMDQLDFSAFYDRVCDLIAKHFLPGVTSAELKAEVEQMIGASTRQAAE
jgi:hypothetical protein